MYKLSQICCSTNIDMTARQTLWGLTIGNTFAWLPFLSCWPQAVQRINSVPKQRQAKMYV